MPDVARHGAPSLPRAGHALWIAAALAAGLAAGALAEPVDGTTGLQLGSEGLDFLHMTGGLVTNCEGCASELGAGIGSGVVNHLGGEIASDELLLAAAPGSFGALAVRGARWNPERAAGTLLRSDRLTVGHEGTGALIQTGGTIEVGERLLLGARFGSVGHYTARGGGLRQLQSGPSQGLYLGGIQGSGVGHLVVIGPGPDLQIAGRYVQHAGSTFTAMFGAQAPHIAPVYVAGSALFELGAILSVQLPVEELTKGTPWSPTASQCEFLLLRAGSLVDRGLLLVGSEAGSWSVMTTKRELRVRYRAGQCG
jgi:hypothetical protein